MDKIIADRDDLLMLNEVYWRLSGGNSTYEEEAAKSLSRIYYTCEDVIRNGTVTDNPLSCNHIEADLTVGDPIARGNHVTTSN